MKYAVTVVKTGCLLIEAESESEAMDIANQKKTDEINWDDGWEVTDATEQD